MNSETITLTRDELAAIIEAAVTEALTEVAEDLAKIEARKLKDREYRQERNLREPGWQAAQAQRKRSRPDFREREREANRERMRRYRENPDFRRRELDAQKAAGYPAQRKYQARKRAEQ